MYLFPLFMFASECAAVCFCCTTWFNKDIIPSLLFAVRYAVKMAVKLMCRKQEK